MLHENFSLKLLVIALPVWLNKLLQLDDRRWVQAVFQATDNNCISSAAPETEQRYSQGDCSEKKDILNGVDIDMSDGMALELFGIASPCEEVCEYVTLFI